MTLYGALLGRWRSKEATLFLINAILFTGSVCPHILITLVFADFVLTSHLLARYARIHFAYTILAAVHSPSWHFSLGGAQQAYHFGVLLWPCILLLGILAWVEHNGPTTLNVCDGLNARLVLRTLDKHAPCSNDCPVRLQCCKADQYFY